MRVAGIRRFRHPDTDKARAYRRTRKLEGRRAAGAVGHGAAGKREPRTLCRLMDGVRAGPILDQITAGVRVCPVDADRVDVLRGSQINDNPLRVQAVVFSRKGLAEVRIAFPVGVRVSVRETRVASAIRPRKALVWERVPERMAD